MKSIHDLLGGILPGLKLDPGKFLANFERPTLTKLLARHAVAAAEREERDGITPALKAISPEGETALIRSLLFMSLKFVVKDAIRAALPPVVPARLAHMLTGGAAGFLADVIRDHYAQAVVLAVSPDLDAGDTTLQAVQLVNAALVEQIV